MKRALVVAACLFVAGCALVQPPPKERPLGPGETLSARAAGNALVVGKSTEAEVRAALGEALVIDFASGYEVWVYRERPAKKEKEEKPPPRPTELVLLFAPSGVLAKTRIH